MLHFQTPHRSLYEALPESKEDKIPSQKNHKSGRNLLFLLPCFIIAVQIVVIMALLARLRKLGDRIYLYSPAEDVLQYEARTFFFGIGDDLSPFQQPPSPALDEMWQDLYSFGIQRIQKSEAAKLPNKTSPIPDDSKFYIAELDVFHQLHCLNMIRQALYPDHYPEQRMGSPKVDEHINHCVDSIRQSLMCSSDISTIVWQWDDAKRKSTFRGNVAHKCRNFDLIREWARANMIQEHFDDKVRIEDDIFIPLYRADGTTYFP